MKKVLNLLLLGPLSMAGAAEAQTHILSDGVKRMTNGEKIRIDNPVYMPTRSRRVKNKIN